MIIVVLPEDNGRWVMKLRDRESHIFPGIGRGCSNPWGAVLNGLVD